MNYLLVMPRVTTNAKEHYHFPLGIAYVSASLKQTRDTVFTLNLNSTELPVKQALERMIKEHGIDVVATGGLSPQYHDVRMIVDFSREIYPKMVTIIGGGLVSASPQLAMRGITSADYAIIGEGEYAICELADCIEGKRKLCDVEDLNTFFQQLFFDHIDACLPQCSIAAL